MTTVQECKNVINTVLKFNADADITLLKQELTNIIVNEMFDAGYEVVYIGSGSNKCNSWRQMPYSICGKPEKGKGKGQFAGWPAVWRIMEKYPIMKAGCGNSDQSELTSEARKYLIEGYYYKSSKTTIS